MPQNSVLLIQADQWPWFCLSYLGSANVRTPNLDRLIREEGMLFSNNTVQSPICLPSRVSMLTGQYVSTTTQYGFCGYCRRGLPWMPRFFQEHGYRTGAFGKMHAMSIGIDDWSFDVSAPTLGEDEILARPAGYHYRNYCEKNGVKWPTDQIHGHDPFNGIGMENGRASSHIDPKSTSIEQESVESDVPLKHSLETWTTDRCIDFLRERAADKMPFFSWTTFDRPHYPTTLPPEWYARRRPDEIELHPLPPESMMRELSQPFFKSCYDFDRSILHLGERRFREVLASYYTLIEWIDAEVGRLLAFLESSGLRESTTVVFTVDHGDQAGRHGTVDKVQFALSESITHGFFVIAPPPSQRVKTDVEINSPTENIDLFPTLATLSGLTPPPEVEGKDLSGILRGTETTDPHRTTFCEDYPVRMVKKDGWRLAFALADDRACALHNLNNDPEQFVNLYHDPAAQGVRIALKKELMAFLCQRLYGGYEPADVERIRGGLDGSLLPLNASSGLSDAIVLYPFRAALLISDKRNASPTKGYQMLVPFYPGESMLLWGPDLKAHEKMYATRAMTIPFAPVLAEPMIDAALRRIIEKMPCVSVFLPYPPGQNEKADPQRIHELYKNLQVSQPGILPR